MNVLGTRVRRGAAAERAVLISDLHLGATADAAIASFDAAVSHARERADALLILGDLFDSYVSRAQVQVGVWRDVADRLAAAAGAGLRVVLLVGNRDFLMGREFERRSGAELVPGGYRLHLGGVDTLLLHGDELCQNDVPYQRAKRWLRHPLTRAVARSLPVSLAVRAADRARAKSRDVIQSGDQGRFLPSARAVEAAVAGGVERLVFGHIHRQSAGSYGATEYRVLPAFDQQGVGLLVEPGRCGAVRFGPGAAPEAVSDGSPCPWSD